MALLAFLAPARTVLARADRTPLSVSITEPTGGSGTYGAGSAWLSTIDRRVWALTPTDRVTVGP